MADNQDQQNADNQDQQNQNQDQQNQNETSWRDTLPEGIRESADLTKFDSVDALAQSYINASQLIGRDKIPMPKSEEEWNETYNRLGRPESIDDYDIITPDNLPEKLKASTDNSIKWFKQTSHDIGLSKEQASKFFNKYTNLITEQTQAGQEKINQEVAETKVALNTEYGDALPAKMVLANRAMDKFGGEGLVKLFAETGLGRDPRVIKAFIGIGELIAEDVGLDKYGEPIESEGDLDAKILELQNRPAYLDAMDPAHQSTVKQVETMMKRRHPKPAY
jgi:hypothetical protein